MSALKEEVANHGRVVVAKAYADWVTRSPELKGASQFINDPPALYASGIEPVYVPTRLPLGTPSAMNSRTTRVKNSVDVKMTADCIECAHSYPNIGTYVLVSGDSDFIHVINSLRAIGKHVIIIGVSWSTSRRLADQVDGLILYDIDVDPEAQPEPTPVPAQPGRSSRTNGGNRQQLSDVMRVIEEIVRSERQAGRTPLLTSLKQRIMRRVPGFDEKKLGFSGFKKLMLRTAEEGNIQLVTVGLVDWVIMADEPIPEEALPETRTGGGAIESVAADEEVIPEAEEPVASQSIAETEVAAEAAAEEPASGSAEEAAAEEEAATPGQPGTEADTSTATDTVTSEIPTDTEATGDAAESVETEEVSTPALNRELEKALEESLHQLELPRGPGDGQDGRRVTDLIIMADMLEHQEGITHVAFNFLLGEVCGALQQGLEAEHPEITGRWGGRTYSRTYVTRLLRELGEKDVFLRGWHQERNEETGRTRRFRTFNLNRSHPLVREAVVSQWGPDTDTIVHEPEAVPNADPDTAPAPEAVDELKVSTNGVEADAEESVPPPRSQASRRRGRQRQTAEEVPQSPELPLSQSEAKAPEGEAVAVTEEVSPPPRAQGPRRRGRQRQTAEEVPQSPEQDSSQSEAEAPEGEAVAVAEEVSPPPRTQASRRRGRQRQPAEEVPQSPEQDLSQSEAEAPEGEAVAVAEEVSPPPRTQASRRRGRQRQTAEEVPQSSDEIADEPAAEESPPQVMAEEPAPEAEPAPAAVD